MSYVLISDIAHCFKFMMNWTMLLHMMHIYHVRSSLKSIMKYLTEAKNNNNNNKKNSDFHVQFSPQTHPQDAWILLLVTNCAWLNTLWKLLLIWYNTRTSLNIKNVIPGILSHSTRDTFLSKFSFILSQIPIYMTSVLFKGMLLGKLIVYTLQLISYNIPCV